MLERILFEEHSILARAFAETADLADGSAAAREFQRLFFALLEQHPGAAPLILKAGKAQEASLRPAELAGAGALLDAWFAASDLPVVRTDAPAPAAVRALLDQADKAGEALLPVTADPALLCLAQGSQRVLLLEKENGVLTPKAWEEGAVREAFGAAGSVLPAALTLKKRLGPHRAKALLAAYGTPEGIRAHLSEIPGAHARDQLSGILSDPAFSDAEAPLPDLVLPGALVPDLEKLKTAAAALEQGAEKTEEKKITEEILRTREEAERYFARAMEAIGKGQPVGVLPLFDTLRFGSVGPLLGAAIALSETESAFLPVSGTEGEDGTVLPEGQLSLFPAPAPKAQQETSLTAAFLIGHLTALRHAAAGHKGAPLAVFGLQKQFPFFGVKGEEFADGIHLHGFFDCLIGAYLINPLKNDYAPRDLGAEYLSDDILPEEKVFLAKRRWSEVLSADEAGTASYVQHAARILGGSAPKIQARLAKEEMADLYENIELPLTFVLYDMQRIGIRVLPEKLKEYGDQLTGRIEELDRTIHEQAGDPDFNIASPKQLGELLFDRMHLPGGKKLKSGWSTSADILEKLAPDYPLVANILEYRALTKLKSTYADGLAEFIAPDSRIHTTFHQTITATGRISSTDPNLQNIPMRTPLGRAIRKVFLPREGWSFTDSDYSQIELRILASMSGDEALIEAYRGGRDIHRMTASKVFNTPFDEVTDLQRRNAKAVNFGIVYGISSFGLSQGLSISRQEAAAYIDQYFKMFPGIKTFLDSQVQFAKTNGYSVTMMGRRRPIPELREGGYQRRQFGERVAMNAPIQGTGADIMKKAMIRVWEMLHREHLSSELILQIHDELLIETAPGEEEKVEQILREGMMGAAQLKVALEVDCHRGSDWYEAK